MGEKNVPGFQNAHGASFSDIRNMESGQDRTAVTGGLGVYAMIDGISPYFLTLGIGRCHFFQEPMSRYCRTPTNVSSNADIANLFCLFRFQGNRFLTPASGKPKLFQLDRPLSPIPFAIVFARSSAATLSAIAVLIWDIASQCCSYVDAQNNGHVSMVSGSFPTSDTGFLNFLVKEQA